jgi:hypothetical protein
MRAGAVVAVVLLLLPAGASAQRSPWPGGWGQGPEWPAPLSPQPASIARELAYRRLPISVESYPVISLAQAPSFTSDGRTATWASFGMGTRAAYRLTHNASATLDVTSSLAGSPVLMQTVEIGTRLSPERSESSRVYPFADVRAGYISAYDRSLASMSSGWYGFPTASGVYGARYSNGFGAVAGIGMEYALTRTFSLTTAGSVMRSHMTAHDFATPQTGVPTFAMTSYRYTMGIRYNPVRLIMP